MGEQTDQRPIKRAALLLALLVALALPAGAHAYTTAGGYQAHDYATGFPDLSCCGWGPIGVAFDQSDNLYVADSADGNLYRFQPGGGQAGPGTRVSQKPIPGNPKGLAITADGRLYLAREQAGDVVELDPATGKVLRVVASGIPCAVGLAVDPISGDLFVTQNRCSSLVWRISGFANGPGTATHYANLSGYCCVDGIAFDRDGTLYTEGGGHVLRLDGTNTATPGAHHEIAFAPTADGMAFAAHAPGDPLPFLVTNRNDGNVTRVGSNGSEQNIFTGGSRGDFAAVDSHGCLYITQSTSIVRITGPGGRCSFSPSTPGTPPPPGLTVDQLTAAAPCVRGRVVVRLRQRGGVRLRSATVYINGRRVMRLRGGRVTAPITLTHLPPGVFTVRIVGVTTHGRRLVRRMRFRHCGGPHCIDARGFRFKIHQLGGRIVQVDAWINGRHVRHVTGFQIRSLVLRHLPQKRFVVRIVTVNVHGHQNITVRTYRGCRKFRPHTIVRHHHH